MYNIHQSEQSIVCNLRVDRVCKKLSLQKKKNKFFILFQATAPSANAVSIVELAIANVLKSANVANAVSVSSSFYLFFFRFWSLIFIWYMLYFFCVIIQANFDDYFFLQAKTKPNAAPRIRPKEVKAVIVARSATVAMLAVVSTHTTQ